ncbi:MAG: response regulator, partial [Anaerohalosphaeraceae bacterium]
ERRQTEEALRASLDRYWSFLDVTGQVGWTTNAAGEVTENMRAWRQFTGQSVEEIKGWGWSKAVHPDDLPYTVEVWREAVEKRKKYETEYRLRRHDGVYRNFLARGVPTYNEDGSVREWVGTCIDITERKQAEESLRRANEELEQRVRDRTAELHYKNRELQRRAEQLSRFASELTLAEQRERNRLAKVLHDHLQQLLVAAKLGLHGLSQSITDEEVAGGIKDVYELIKQSIDTSRSLTVELSPTILHEAGLGAGLEWLARWMQHKHGLIVNLQLDEKAQTVREDIRILLFESVRELLFNVVKHAGVTRANVRLARRDDKLEIVVSDEGAGFDPRRVHEVDGAAGFGLFSIRERLELLGGSLKIESAPQRGAKFTLIAPTVYPVETVKARIERKREQTQAEPQEALKRAARGQTLRILIVDDHKVIRQGMAARLKREPDLEIAGEAGDGEEAIERAHALRPNVILMDYSMPRMDGVEATRRIHAALPEIRIIGLSMYQEADRAKAMYDAGAAAYVTKSAELDDLLRAIRANHTPK